MKSSHTPTKHAIPFGQNGNKRDIPLESKTGSGEASLSLGFPPETMVPKVSGGIPPSGKDFNGILNELSAMGRWANAGAGYPFDAAFANAVGGYPAGAKIPNVENSGFWLNTVDNNNNLDNPEVADDRLTGRVPAENYGIATLSGLVKADVTLTTLQSAKARIVLTGELKANMAVIFPAWQTSWTVVNQCTGSGSLICRTKAGAGVVVPKGESREIIGDGSGLVPRIVNASTTVAGITQLSSAIDSDSETLAATPKAVKALADTLSSGRLLNIQSFTKSGIYTPTLGTRKIRVKCWGAGGGGAGTSTNGGATSGAGGDVEGLYVLPNIATIEVVVGSGGASVDGDVAANGGDGGASSIMALSITADGGGGGQSTGNLKGGKTSGPSGSIILIQGQGGMGSLASFSDGIGGAFFSSSGGVPHVGGPGECGGYPGGGGAGAFKSYENSAHASGRGADGLVIVEEYS
ncbi:Phage tail fibre repeat protein [Sodalis glossinidius str. 'morsitans']|uniref:Phage tail fibre repeat protein n=2 Tax=Sodalis glossinidius (strain morsitans) TaxID=343509 RepID=A0A193QJ40_SODGM|nr:phage tail protein [Sodalis glossinidius]CRL45192.1 Phage tail fibre repeat protein [Sodalis glossinidius str. 'morsitans']